MPRTLEDIFNDYRGLEIIEFVGFNDGGRFGISEDAKSLKILDTGFARELAELPGADTETGHITPEGYQVKGHYNFQKDSYEATVCLSVKE